MKILITLLLFFGLTSQAIAADYTKDQEETLSKKELQKKGLEARAQAAIDRYLEAWDGHCGENSINVKNAVLTINCEGRIAKIEFVNYSDAPNFKYLKMTDPLVPEGIILNACSELHVLQKNNDIVPAGINCKNE